MEPRARTGAKRGKSAPGAGRAGFELADECSLEI